MRDDGYSAPPYTYGDYENGFGDFVDGYRFEAPIINSPEESLSEEAKSLRSAYAAREIKAHKVESSKYVVEDTLQGRNEVRVLQKIKHTAPDGQKGPFDGWYVAEEVGLHAGTRTVDPEGNEKLDRVNDMLLSSPERVLEESPEQS